MLLHRFKFNLSLFKLTMRTKIYTKTGDTGTTSVIGGIRKNKDDNIFHILGDIDELNSYLGVVKSSFLKDLVS